MGASALPAPMRLLLILAVLALAGCAAPTPPAKPAFHGPQTLYDERYEFPGPGFPAKSNSSTGREVKVPEGATALEMEATLEGYASTDVEGSWSVALSDRHGQGVCSSRDFAHLSGSAPEGTCKLTSSPADPVEHLWYNGTGGARVHVVIVAT